MAFTDMPEVWVLVTGLTLIGLGILMRLMRVVAPTTKPGLMRHWMLAIFSGALVFGSSFIIASARGHGSAFATSLLSPLSLAGEFFSFEPATYAQSCANGRCAKYCCTDKVYPELKWKDCSQFCTGYEGHFGELTGDNCLGDLGRNAYCKADADTSTKSVIQVDGCNFDPAEGPVTCTCCVNSSEKYWWDCDKTCGSFGDEKGSTMAQAACANVTKYHCLEVESDVLTDDTNNEQSF